MLDINQPIFTYAGALKPEVKKSHWQETLLAVCAGLLIAGLLI